MKVGLFTSSNLRHAYIAHRLREQFDLRFVLQERKGLSAYYKKQESRDLVQEHFDRLDATEKEFFSETTWDNFDGEMRSIEWGTLNTRENADYIASFQPDAIAVFGCGIIKSPVLDVLPPGKTFNIHQGLSPYLRGVGTNFWPFVTGDLGYIGVTLHLIDPGIDTGPILAHERPDIAPDDTQHTLGCKTVVKSADVLCKALHIAGEGGELHPFPQWKKGKLYLSKDLTPESILQVREREASGYVAEYLKRREAGEILPVQLLRLEY